MKQVLVTIPNQMWVHKHVSAATNKLILDARYRINISYPTNRPYENNLHKIVVDFLGGKYDYWLNIDSDNPPINNPLDLIELDKDILGLPTPVLHINKKGERPVYFNAYKYVPEKDAYTEHPNREGLQRVDAIGTGCFIMARRVFENGAMQKGAFQRSHYSNGVVHKGNDIMFCERANEQGFEIWSHFDYPCRHFHEVELLETAQAFSEVKNGG